MLTRALLEGMQRMGYAAVNVGERDLQRGHAGFLEIAGSRSFPFVSANIVREDTKQPVFAPSVVLEGRRRGEGGPLRVGIIGVARFNPLFRKPGPDGSELVIVAPADVVRKEVERLRAGHVDLVVLLAAMHRDDARRLAGEVPGIDFVIGSYGGDYTTSREQAGRTWIVYTGNQGKRFAETRVYLRGDVVEQETRIHLLTAAYPADDAMQQFVQSVERPAPEALPNVGEAPAADPAAERLGPYVGTAACTGCHARENAHWRAGAHAAALGTLGPKQATGRAECRSCHAAAAGAPEAEAQGAGCESCHGAGRRHVQDPRSDFGAVQVAACTRCHDAANSPHFDFYAYLPRVEHRTSGTR